jgi:hypothetical protein
MRQEIEPEADSFRQLFTTTWQAFAQACTRFAAASSIWLDVGGSVVHVRFAGPVMRPQMLPALAHLQVPPQP